MLGHSTKNSIFSLIPGHGNSICVKFIGMGTLIFGATTALGIHFRDRVH